MPAKQTIDQTVPNLGIKEGEYDLLRLEQTTVNMELLSCLDSRNVANIPAALDKLKTFLNKIDGKYPELFRRPLQILHSILISRMYYNTDFKSPMYEYDLEAMAAYASSEVEFRNLYAIYINAIENSLVKEA